MPPPPHSPSKVRLDQLLVDRGLAGSREEARRLVLAGQVRVGDEVSDKPGRRISSDARIGVKERLRYVGRGGLKLEAALNAFGVGVEGRVCLDAGASTGGFTDCLLQRGAARVYAFDVGTNQLAWKIRSDPRVVAREKFNIRGMTPADIGEQIDLVAVDVSFISLRLILPPCARVRRSGGDLIALIKPQFELSRSEVGKGGVVRDVGLRQRAVENIRAWCAKSGLEWMGVIPCPVLGAAGNQEFLAWMR